MGIALSEHIFTLKHNNLVVHTVCYHVAYSVRMAQKQNKNVRIFSTNWGKRYKKNEQPWTNQVHVHFVEDLKQE